MELLMMLLYGVQAVRKNQASTKTIHFTRYNIHQDIKLIIKCAHCQHKTRLEQKKGTVVDFNKVNPKAQRHINVRYVHGTLHQVLLLHIITSS